MKTGTRAEIQSFDPELPIERASAPPASWYVDRDLFGHERQAVFGRNWQVVGRAQQVARPGDFTTADLGGERVLVARDRDGLLRAFHNVCRHRAAAVAEGQGNTERFVCAYHGWTYDLDGRLRSAPGLAGIEEFDRERCGLAPMAVEVLGPLVFVHPGADPSPLAEDLAGLVAELDASGWGELRHVTSRSYTIECNWKVYADNYLDGGYHIAHLHHSLAGQLALDSYRTEVHKRYSIQRSGSSGGGAGAPAIDFAERFSDPAAVETIYAWVYPNLAVNRYGPVMDTNLVVPRGPERCEVVFDFWFRETEGAQARRFIERSLAASHRIQEEDVRISEMVQVGMRSTSYERGRYAPRIETALHHFHRLLAEDLAAFWS